MSFSSDELPSLTLMPESAFSGPVEDFDLQILDAPAPSAATSRSSFDLDELLANGPSGVERERDRDRNVERAIDLDLDLALDLDRPQPAEVGPVSSPVVVAAPPPPPPPPPPLPPQPIVPVAQRSPALAVAGADESSSRAKPNVVSAAAPPRSSAPMTTELPLFMQGMSNSSAVRAADVEHLASAVERVEEIAASPVPVEEIDDRPLVQVPAVPRTPLAVRRATPDPARLKAKYARTNRQSAISGDLLQGIDDPTTGPVEPVRATARLSAEPTPASLPAGWLQGVGIGKRLVAASVDVLLLGGVNALVVWFTLAVCGLTPAQATTLPVIPIGVFFLMIDGGYLVLFTAACGQTVGKMLAGIRVVGTSADSVINDRLTLSQSIARSISVFASLGLGLVMSFGGDGRAMHDRIAHTRVVRA